MSGYHVDIVFCIDATGSMRHILDMVKTNALNFYRDTTECMKKKDKMVEKLRVRVIAFRDYKADGPEAMLATDFFELPQDAREFESLINTVQPKGGGDIPEDGLEALAFAMKSKWTEEGQLRRHVIVVWSDAGTHELGFGKDAPNYPKKMAKDFGELTDWWGDSSQQGVMDRRAKRLLIFAPDQNYWNAVSGTWDNVLHFPSEAGKGLAELDYNVILDAIANSI